MNLSLYDHDTVVLTVVKVMIAITSRLEIIIIIIIIGFSVYLHNTPGDITQFNNKSMPKTKKNELPFKTGSVSDGLNMIR